MSGSLTPRGRAETAVVASRQSADYAPAAGPLSSLGSWVRRWRWTLLGTFSVVVAAVGLLTMAIPTRYHSEVSFLVEPRTGQALSPALSVLEKLGSAKSTETEIELLRSRRVAEPVVEELGLHVEVKLNGEALAPSDLFPAFAAGPDARPGAYRLRREGDTYQLVDAAERVVAQSSGQAELRHAGLTLQPPEPWPGEVELRVRPFGEVVEKVRREIDPVTVNSDADVIRLSCGGPTPERARDLCAGISASYLQMRASLQRAEATATAEFLEGQVAQVGEQLAAAEDELRGYERENRVVALEERASEGVRQFAQLKAQRDQLAAEAEALAAWSSQVRGEGTDPSRFRDLASFPTLFRAQNQAITQLLASLVELENRRSELSVVRSAGSVEMIAVDARIRQIEDQLQALAGGYQTALAAQVASLDALLEQSGQALSMIPSQQIASARLQRQVSLLEELYRFLQTRLQEAEVAQAVNLPSVRIVDQASLPFRASWPNLPLNLSLGVVLGLGAAMLVALLREHTDRRIREREEVERETGISVLGMVPHLPRPGPVVPVRLRGSSGVTTLAPLRGAVDREIALEAFRSIWTDIGFLSARDGLGPVRTIAVTSASRGEGKTFTTCNLAAARAARGMRTLLIDADVRASGVARFFDLPARRAGVSDVLAGRTDLASATEQLVVGERHSLHVLAAGSPTSRSAELIESSAFDRLLEQASAEHELVIIDTPPLNVLTDAASIAARVDAVVVVVRGEITERDALRHTLQRLARANGRVIGIVLNDAKLPHYYQSYSYVDTAATA